MGRKNTVRQKGKERQKEKERKKQKEMMQSKVKEIITLDRELRDSVFHPTAI